MSSRNKLIFLLFCLFVIIKLGEAVKCYSCSSAQNSLCGDDFRRKNFRAFECPGSCIKTRGRDSDNMLEINRFCGDSKSDTCYNSVYNQIDVNMCWCNTDFCNPASKPLPTCGVFIVSLLAFLSFCFLSF